MQEKKKTRVSQSAFVSCVSIPWSKALPTNNVTQQAIPWRTESAAWLLALVPTSVLFKAIKWTIGCSREYLRVYLYFWTAVTRTIFSSQYPPCLFQHIGWREMWTYEQYKVQRRQVYDSIALPATQTTLDAFPNLLISLFCFGEDAVSVHCSNEERSAFWNSISCEPW